MEREALKNIGFGSDPFYIECIVRSLAKLFISSKVNWVPTYFSPEEAAQIEKICEGICPKTETPGALEAGCHIDAAMTVMGNEPEAELLKKGMAVFVENFNSNQEVSIYEASTEQMTEVINDYFTRYNEDQSIFGKMREAMGTNDGSDMAPELLEAFFVSQIVDSTFWAILRLS